jgi:hypothetical protein
VRGVGQRRSLAPRLSPPPWPPMNQQARSDPAVCAAQFQRARRIDGHKHVVTGIIKRRAQLLRSGASPATTRIVDMLMLSLGAVIGAFATSLGGGVILPHGNDLFNEFPHGALRVRLVDDRVSAYLVKGRLTGTQVSELQS